MKKSSKESTWTVCFKVEVFGNVKVKGCTRADVAETLGTLDPKDLATKGEIYRAKVIGIVKEDTQNPQRRR